MSRRRLFRLLFLAVHFNRLREDSRRHFDSKPKRSGTRTQPIELVLGWASRRMPWRGDELLDNWFDGRAFVRNGEQLLGLHAEPCRQLKDRLGGRVDLAVLDVRDRDPVDPGRLVKLIPG